jgi:hypothetical protein
MQTQTRRRSAPAASLALSLSLGLLLLLAGQVTAQSLTRDYTPVYDFVDNLADATQSGKMKAAGTAASVGGVGRPALSQHPDSPGEPLVKAEFADVQLPTLAAGERLVLRFSLGIRDGFSPAENPIFDGCEFLLLVNGKEAFRKVWSQQKWQDEVVDLGAFAGQKITIAFEMSPRSNPAYDWAVWGEPNLRIEGRASEIAIAKIPFLKLSALDAVKLPSRVVMHEEAGTAATVVLAMDRDLDLSAQLGDLSGEVKPPVPPAPELVVGEGEDPGNHTLVKVLDGYGIARVQFLAYGPEVMGGVQVEGGDSRSLGPCIVTAPLSSTQVRQVRVFDRQGGLLGEFEPGARLQPPYLIAMGDFLRNHPGDEVAITSRYGLTGMPCEVLLYDTDGSLLSTYRVRGEVPAGPRAMSAARDALGARLVLTLPQQKRAAILDPSAAFDPATNEGRWRDLPPLPEGGAAYLSATATDTFLVAGPEKELSTLWSVAPDGRVEQLNVGRRENLFYLEGYVADDPAVGEGQYVKRGRFRHIRTDLSAPAASDPALCERDPEAVGGPDFLQRHLGVLDGYDKELPSTWEPCFTHRMMKGSFKAWHDVIDPETKLPRYLMLTRKDNPVDYGEFDTSGFNASTYAFGIPGLENLYVRPLRTFLHNLAPRFRSNPEHFVQVEPNHEHEIAVERDGTVGDYNPRMIEGFYQYLRSLYGGDGASLNGEFGTPFAEYFDAPRQFGRGAWDETSGDNPFFRQWVDYNRYVVTRRVAQTFREALLAGFPPESIACHQIPDLYAIGDTKAFSKVVSRITPVDYMLNAGVGYGFTRYGVWYKKDHDALQDAHRSGFDMISIGEYQALHPDADVAYQQLRFIFENGGYGVHCMNWPAGYDKGYNLAMTAAAKRLVEKEAPRPGMTGGVGQVRSVGTGDQAFHIACLGTGPEHTGLLKSLRKDGSWEGSVYVVPFHAHVEVERLPVTAQQVSVGQPVTIGPLEGLDSGSQVEVSFWAQAPAETKLGFRVERDGRPLPGMADAVTVGTQWRFCRFVLRVQLPVDKTGLVLTTDEAQVSLRDFTVTRQTERTPKLTTGKLDGQAHRGSVTFDVLSQ